MNIDGDEFDGPLGAVLSVVFGGAGLLLAGVILTAVAAFLCVLFAGLGIVAVAAIAMAATIAAAAISPLLLPLLIPFGLYWLLVARPRKRRLQATVEQAV